MILRVFGFVLAMALGFGGAFFGGERLMKLTSEAFEDGKPIPKTFTCQGKNVSPPLTLSNVPANTKSFAIIVDDPDAPGGTFDHWIAWNLPAGQTAIPEGVKPTQEGTNHMQKVGYFGPCPPQGPAHHYHFKVFALDRELALPKGSTKEELLQAIEGHILAQSELVGLYQRE